LNFILDLEFFNLEYIYIYINVDFRMSELLLSLIFPIHGLKALNHSDSDQIDIEDNFKTNCKTMIILGEDSMYVLLTVSKFYFIFLNKTFLFI
jgi:hypothetical protein